MEGTSAGILGGLAFILIKSTISKLSGWLKYVVLFFLVLGSLVVISYLLSGAAVFSEILLSTKLWMWVVIVYGVLAFIEAAPYLDKIINNNEKPWGD
ncbi:MAG: hypothetical protein VW882_05745 [Gammaproteobacteria bacterium]